MTEILNSSKIIVEGSVLCHTYSLFILISKMTFFDIHIPIAIFPYINI